MYESWQQVFFPIGLFHARVFLVGTCRVSPLMIAFRRCFGDVENGGTEARFPVTFPLDYKSRVVANV